MQLIVDPPLGTTTVLTTGQILSFAVSLIFDTPQDISALPLEVELWSNIARRSQTWESHPFHFLAALSDLQRFVYECNVPVDQPGNAEFTIRCRMQGVGQWDWIGNGINGKLRIEDNMSFFTRSLSIEDFLYDVNPNLQVQTIQDNRLWRFDVDINRLRIEQKVVLAHLQSFSKAVAYARLSQYWIVPLHCHNTLATSKQFMALALQYTNLEHAFIIPEFSTDFAIALEVDGNGFLLLSVKTTSVSTISKVSVFVSAHANIYDAMEQVPLESSDRSIHDNKITSQNSIKLLTNGDFLKPEKSLFDQLTYCTWNSLGENVSADTIIQVLKEFQEQGIKPTNLLIDDGWQTTDNKKRLASFEANDRFPGGLSHFVRRVKETFPHIKHVGVWVSLWGYWNGIAPTSSLSDSYTLCQAEVMSEGKAEKVMIVSETDVDRFYASFYKFLSDSGIDFVKVDCQAKYELLEDPAHMAVNAYLNALHRYSQAYFQGNIIHCMAHAGGIFRKLAEHSSTSRRYMYIRSSDDYFPNQEDSHTWHVFVNFINSQFLRSITKVQPDFDMFQTHHKNHSDFHAAARAISGGPIMISDELGFQHDQQLIHALLAQDIQGNFSALRASHSRPIELFTDAHKGRHFLTVEIFNHVQNPAVGIFNCTGAQISEVITLRHFPNLDRSKNHVFTCLSDNMIFKLLPFERKLRHIVEIVSLESRSWCMISAAPLLKLNKSMEIAFCGLADKINGLGALTEQVQVKHNDGYDSVVVLLSGRSSKAAFFVQSNQPHNCQENLYAVPSCVGYSAFLNGRMLVDAITFDESNPNLMYIDLMQTDLYANSSEAQNFELELCMREGDEKTLQTSIQNQSSCSIC